MGKINVLSFAVANLIAAGEVVDRPSSVIKELLENAIDSGASRITVEIQNGGVTYMRVADNGCGISAEDLPVAIRRHATSKIQTAEDLSQILTLGFRGEALAAIASVSELRIISKTQDALTGSMLHAKGGDILGISERAASNGTTVIVENLFANVPARRKFLKKDATEAMAIGAVVEKIALSKPHIAFRLIVDGNVKLETIGDGNLKNTIYAVFGKEFTGKLLEIRTQNEGITLYGFIGRSDNVRANRNYQNFFINGRYVKSRTAGAAIEQAYTSYLPPDKFPCCVLFLEVSPQCVDVNVHPSKLEVKFSNEKPIFEAIYYAVRDALESSTDRPDLKINSHTWTASERISDRQTPIRDEREESLKKRQLASDLSYAKPSERTPISIPKTSESEAIKKAENESKFISMSAEEYIRSFKSETKEKRSLDIPSTLQKSIGSTVPEIPKEPTKQIPSPSKTATSLVQEPCVSVEIPKEVPSESVAYRIVGEVFHSYVIVEKHDTVLFIDKHAAHERILFEKLKAGLHDVENVSQLLLLPIEIMMTSDEIQTLVQYKEELTAIGFEFSSGRYTLTITAIPEGVESDAVSDMLTVIADRILNHTGSAKLTRDIIFEKALYQAACKAAIKAGRVYPPEYTQWLVQELMRLPDITVCPHGRPVAMELSKKTLDHQFERS